ncbi:carbohydrate ABC transporter permease, partial [bacterium]|nr:carbohydrate ABC transporter permease [bacterium]
MAAIAARRDRPPTNTRISRMVTRFATRLPLHLTILLIVILWSIPTLALLVSSFREPTAISATGWWHAITAPANFTWDNYDRVLNQRGMGRAFINSFIISVPATLLVLLVASMAAYAFAWMSFPFRNSLFLVMVALLVVPVQITLIPILRLYADHLTVHITVPLIGGNLFGVSSFPGLWLAHTAFGLPFAVYLLRNFFGSLPRELIESAQLDGASDAKIFFRIILPLSTP